MGNSDEKKINHEVFEKTITMLSELQKQLVDKREGLKNTNDTLIDEDNWKGTSRNYYNQIAIDQDKAFEKINESLKQFIVDLNDTLDKFEDLDTSIANSFEG